MLDPRRRRRRLFGHRDSDPLAAPVLAGSRSAPEGQALLAARAGLSASAAITAVTGRGQLAGTAGLAAAGTITGVTSRGLLAVSAGLAAAGSASGGGGPTGSGSLAAAAGLTAAGAAVTPDRLWPSTSGPATSIASGTSFVFGVGFEVTVSGWGLYGWYWWVAGDGLQNTAAQSFGLWEETGLNTGSYVTGSKVTSGTFSGGQWNFVSAGTPIPLTQSQAYRAVCTATPGSNGHPFADTSGYFTSGQPGGNGLSTGNLLGFSDGNTGGSNKDPTGTGQMTNFSGGTDVTADYPTTTSHSSYWLDVLVGPI